MGKGAGFHGVALAVLEQKRGGDQRPVKGRIVDVGDVNT